VANRAPTPAELSCAGPTNSCSLANFFVGDPDLHQVVSYTTEAGVRGSFAPFDGANLAYNVALFRSNLDNDIAFINSVTAGRAFFANVGQTRRQGVDVGLQFKTDRWRAYIQYSYIDASFQNGFVEAAGSNPAADANGNITVRPGNRLPGIPANQAKLGAYYKVTDKWTIGGTVIVASGAFLFGDEANLTPKLPPYFTMNLSTSYQLTDHMQLFGLVQNVTNAKYYTFGTFSPTSSVFIAQAPGATNPRSLSPAAPVGGFGGVRLTF
jgi:outer membrane receptor protein involved in Fe transport